MNLNADPHVPETRRSTKDMPMNMKPICGHLAAKRLAFVVAVAVTALPLAAHAQRKSPLADAPAIRKRFELRKTRFELGAGFASTLNQDFYHTMFFNVRAGFHINDWLSIAAFGGFAIANIETQFQHDLIGSLNPDNMPNAAFPNEPTQTQASSTMQKINSILGAQLEFTPFTGKYSLFGKLFANYDFYVFGGPGLISVKSADAAAAGRSCDQPATAVAPGASAPASNFGCSYAGSKVGANFGLGLHSFFNQWLALNVELRDILAKLNPSGRDANGDGHADLSDQTWTHTYMVTANLMFFLPPSAHVSQ
jgi:outer membrane beta-barrel protein